MGSLNGSKSVLTDLEEFVEAVGCLGDEDVPSTVVVVLARQPVHSHLVDERVGSDDVVPLVKRLALTSQSPRGLARARKPNDHDELHRHHRK